MRYASPPMTIAEFSIDGPPVKIADLAAVSGLSKRTVLNDVTTGHLAATARERGGRVVYIVHRQEARRWLTALGFHVEHFAHSA